MPTLVGTVIAKIAQLFVITKTFSSYSILFGLTLHDDVKSIPERRTGILV
jgi:hypothetical protein